MTDKLIFEDPANRLPEWAKWVANDGSFLAERSLRPGIEEYSIRRIVRLTDPAYYCESNPYTGDEGFLRHNGAPTMPEWLSTRTPVQVWMEGNRTGDPLRPAGGHAGACNWLMVVSYRVLPKEPTETDTPVTMGVDLASGPDETAYYETDTSGGSVDGGDTTTPAKESIGTAVRQLRKEKGLTQDELAQAVGMSRTSIVNLEAGRQNLSHPNLRKIAAALGCSPGALFGDSDEDLTRYPTDQESRHRNELAARLGVPVPGMSEWLEGPLREARRYEYQKAALQGLLAQDDVGEQVTAAAVSGYADAMIEKEG